jgi:hypothetical protein
MTNDLPMLTGSITADRIVINRNYEWRLIRHPDPGFLKLIIGKITLGTIKPSRIEAGKHNWHCALPGIKAIIMNGSEETEQAARAKLLQLCNAWFMEVDKLK